jgi:hypothetical protein
MITSTIERAAILAVVALALAVGCNTPEPASKTASADKPKPADKTADKPGDKTKGGGGSDEVAEGPPTEPEEDGEQPEEDEFTGYDPRVVQAARVARDIAADPKAADDVLAKQSLDREKLDALMYEIAGDPDLTEQYRFARGL